MDGKLRTAPLRILVIEDSRDFADVVVEAVRALGHEPTAEYSMAGALRQLSDTSPFDVVMTDLTFPDGGDGLDVARRVRSLRSAGKCPIRSLVAISGHDDYETRDAARHEGFDHYLCKPVTFEQIEDVLLQVS
ncbi:MAG: response regulator [Tepidisphaeraceae bacterium]